MSNYGVFLTVQQIDGTLNESWHCENRFVTILSGDLYSCYGQMVEASLSALNGQKDVSHLNLQGRIVGEEAYVEHIYFKGPAQSFEHSNNPPRARLQATYRLVLPKSEW